MNRSQRRKSIGINKRGNHSVGIGQSKLIINRFGKFRMFVQAILGKTVWDGSRWITKPTKLITHTVPV